MDNTCVTDDSIKEAMQIVLKAFKGKKDKAGEPYINHLLRVSASVQKYGGIEQVVALLHDLLEDCPEWSQTKLRGIFPHKVVDAIFALTHKKGQSYDDYISEVLQNDVATIVKRADLEDNMNIARLPELNESDIKRLKKYHAAYIRITEHRKLLN